MSKPKMVLGLLGAFILGCAATQIGPVVVPPARAGTTPQKWEYVCRRANVSWTAQVEQMTAMANAYGSEGWEMTGIDNATGGGLTWCFKRPL